MRSIILVVLFVSIVAGCSHYFEGYTYGPRDLRVSAAQRKDIRIGHFYTGMYRKAFYDEWGLPDKTLSMDSEEFAAYSARVSGHWGGANYFKGKVALDVWVYEQREVTLVFNGQQLVGWKTEKVRKDLESPQK